MTEKIIPGELPEEIIINPNDFELKENAEGKKYQYEKEGVYYGGDYLNEPPVEVDINFPAAPEEKDSLVI